MRPKLPIQLPILFLALANALPALAEVYKCRLPNGQTEISSQPCANGSTLAVRPEEKVSEEARQSAEQDLARARAFIEKREASQRASEAGDLERARLNAAQERQRSPQERRQPSPEHNYSNTDQCLRDVDQMVLDALQRSALEADCRRIGGAPQSPPQIIYVPVPAHQYTPPPAPVIHVPPRPSTPAAPASPPARMILKRPGG